MIKVFTYGIFRADLTDNYKEIVEREVVLQGYKMYDLGGCPGIIYTGSLEDKIVGDILLVDKQISRRIDQIELGAGYTVITEQKGDHIFKLYEQVEHIPRDREIPSGNWLEKEQKFVA